MTMHLAHPALTMGGKKKGKQKFRNAEEARKARELDASWKELQKRWDVDADEKRRKRALSAEPLTYKLSTPVGRETYRIQSRNTGDGIAASRPAKVYTGEECIGIGQMHKSNAVPIFRKQDAEDLAKMRRN